MAIVLCEHDVTWRHQAELLISDLTQILGSDVAKIDHVGSTAVPGIAAKPKLHIDVTLRKDVRPDSLAETFCSFGYVNLGFLFRQDEVQLTRSAGPRLRRVAAHEADSLMAHRLCLCRTEARSPLERRLFRDALLQDPSLAQRYQQLKETLVREFGATSDWSSYNRGKAGFIASVVQSMSDERQFSKKTS